MATKTKKKSVRRKPGVTAGKVFGRMLEEARYFEYMVYGPEDNPWDMGFIDGGLVKDSVFLEDGEVHIPEILYCDEKEPAVIKGDTVEVKEYGGDQVYLFRFYKAERINLKDLVKSKVD